MKIMIIIIIRDKSFVETKKEKMEKRKKKEVKITEEDIQREILKARKEAERKAKEEEEEKARKEAREKKRERSPEASATAGVSIAQLTATKGKEDDEAKERTSPAKSESELAISTTRRA